jgi:hypothetical protein
VSPLWKRSSRAGEDLAQRFDQLGLFDLLEAEAAARAKDEIARKGIDGLFTVDVGRSVFAGDAEDLAEGGVGEFLETLRPHLAQRGVTFGETEDLFGDDADRYDVRVGSDVHTIYDLAGADADARDSMARGWALAWVRAFRIVNDLLATANAQERAYTMPEWDVWFLTPEQFDAIRSALPKPRDRPYEPVDDPPWYGAAH